MDIDSNDKSDHGGRGSLKLPIVNVRLSKSLLQVIRKTKKARIRFCQWATNDFSLHTKASPKWQTGYLHIHFHHNKNTTNPLYSRMSECSEVQTETAALLQTIRNTHNKIFTIMVRHSILNADTLAILTHGVRDGLSALGRGRLSMGVRVTRPPPPQKIQNS